MLSNAARRTYAAAWALFTDWCAVTGHRDLPADPATVIAFLADCPAAPEDPPAAGRGHRPPAHRDTGIRPPGRSAAVLAALGRPTGEPRQLPVGDRGRGRGGAAGAAQSRLDAGHVRPAGPLPAGALPAGGGAVQTPRHADRRRRHRRRRHRDDHQLRPADGRSSPDDGSGAVRVVARSPAGCGCSTWPSPRSTPGSSPPRWTRRRR